MWAACCISRLTARSTPWLQLDRQPAYYKGLPCPADQPKCDVYETWRTINVSKVNIPGLELEWDWKPWRGGRVGGGFAYINTSVHDFNSYSDDYQCDVRTELGLPACPAARMVGFRVGADF